MLLLVAFLKVSFAKVYFEENFTSDDWQKNWVQSTFREDYGTPKVTHGRFPTTHSDESKGLKLPTDARHYAIASELKTPLDTSKSPLVFQFSVKHEQNLDCGGAYFKLLPPGVDLKKFHGQEDETQYNVMFGPDVCGSSRRTHAILNYKGTNHLVKETIPPPVDELSHMFTFVLHPNQTFFVLVDGDEKLSGNVTDHWDVLPPKKIKDPKAEKPSDWDEREYIVDPEDKKPSDWDAIPEYINDPDATKPSDWDEEMDGEWEAPKIKNPDFQGKWTPKQIKNPEFKGIWIHPEIDNPDFKPDASIGHYKIGAIGLEVWQVKSGSLFSNILITDSESEAAKAREQFFAFAAIEKKEKQAEDAKNAPSTSGDAKFPSAEDHSGHDHSHGGDADHEHDDEEENDDEDDEDDQVEDEL